VLQRASEIKKWTVVAYWHHVILELFGCLGFKRI